MDNRALPKNQSTLEIALELGIDPKLRVLQRIDQLDCAKVQNAISDPDVLIEAVRAYVKKS
jgi:hypothetical protein